MHVSWDNPHPQAQTAGLVRTLGDADLWTFTLVLDGVEFVRPPTWTYAPNADAANWGTWNVADDNMSLDWLAPAAGLKQAGSFSVSVSGRIRRSGGGGGGGGDDEEDFGAEWNGQVLTYSLTFLQSEVAAGAVGSAAHQAKLQLKITDSNGNPQAGVTVSSALAVTSGGWGRYDVGQPGPQDDPVTATVAIDNPHPGQPVVTAADGTATATFTSGNRTQAATVTLNVNGDGSGPTASINQVWNDLPDNEQWVYDPYFTIDEATPVTYKIAIIRGSGDQAQTLYVDGHALSFVTTNISGWEWNYNTNQYDYKNYSQDEATSINDPDDPQAIGWNKWKGLSAFSNMRSSNGSYTADQTIKDGKNNDGDVDFYTDYVGFNADDASAVHSYQPH